MPDQNKCIDNLIRKLEDMNTSSSRLAIELFDNVSTLHPRKQCERALFSLNVLLRKGVSHLTFDEATPEYREFFEIEHVFHEITSALRLMNLTNV